MSNLTDTSDKVRDDITQTLATHYREQLDTLVQRCDTTGGTIVARVIDDAGYICTEKVWTAGSRFERGNVDDLAYRLADGRHPAHEIFVNAAEVAYVQIFQRHEGDKVDVGNGNVLDVLHWKGVVQR